MPRWWRPWSVVLALVLAGPVVDAAAQEMDRGASPPAAGEPYPLHPKALGSYTRPISSKVPQVQAYFDQGVQLMYAFGTADARRSFVEAERRDPECAMCYWGEAWSWGSYLNGRMPGSQAPYAFAAIQKAAALAPGRTSGVERALIEAMAVRYVADFEESKRRRLDEGYARAMRQVYERYPDDLDVATLYAESLFLLEPRRGARDITTPNVQRILAVLERAVTRERHVGACHLLIHLTEATTEPERAEACADFIGNAIPGASHINHMPSHTWNQLGRWGDSVRANIQAWHSDQKAAIGEGFAIYPAHNLHMLAFAASMDGQGAIAIQAGKDYEKATDDSMFLVLTLVRFGRFDEIRELTEPPPAGNLIANGVWDFGQGYAALRAGETGAAWEHLAQLRAEAGSNARFRMHAAGDLLGTLAGILEGEIHRRQGDLASAIDALERAAADEDRMIYDEPEPLPFAARHWLGAALLDARRYGDAERVYREDLEKHPHNGWSLFGLRAALDGQGKPSDDVAADLEASWARSDFWLRRSSPE